MRVCVITGCSSGIGFEVLVQLAAKSIDISFVLINRTADDNKRVTAEVKERIPSVKIEATFAVDLSELDDVISVSQRVKARIPVIDILVLNAGIMMVPFGMSHTGVEHHMNVNYLSNKVLVDVLLPNLLNSEIGSRVICTSSVAHAWSGEKFTFLQLKPSPKSYGSGVWLLSLVKKVSLCNLGCVSLR